MEKAGAESAKRRRLDAEPRRLRVGITGASGRLGTLLCRALGGPDAPIASTASTAIAIRAPA